MTRDNWNHTPLAREKMAIYAINKIKIGLDK